MTTDEKVELARQLASALQVRRTEWTRWATYFRQCQDLSKALQLAEHLAKSPAVRRDPQEAARCIAKVVGEPTRELQRIPIDDLTEVFGYVGRWLEWLNWQSQWQGRERHEKTSARHIGRKPGGRHRGH
jgi:hypothetical protein